MSTQEKDILAIMQVVAKHAQCEEVWWRTDGKYAPVTFFVNCSDTFCWGCSDAEDLTIENLPVFDQACKDVGRTFGPELFVARVRGERPQGAFYKLLKPSEAALFDAAGPPRQVNLVNPQTNTPGRPE